MDGPDFLSSIEMEDDTEDIAVLVAESEDPYRQSPLTSSFHLALTGIELSILRTDCSLPDDESAASSSSPPDGRDMLIARPVRSDDLAGRRLISRSG